MNCTQCGAVNEESSKFCGKCGHSLLKKLSCAKCGKTLEPDARFCDGCGTKIDSSTIVMSSHEDVKTKYKEVNEAGDPISAPANILRFFSRKHAVKWMIILAVVSVVLFFTWTNVKHTEHTNAEWKDAVSTDNGNIYYVDLASISKTGGIASMWILMNYSDAYRGNRNAKSDISKTEFECDTRTSKTSSNIYYYSGSMGKGDLISRFYRDPDDYMWMDFTANSVTHELWKIACDK